MEKFEQRINIEKGHNVNVMIHLMRHGRKGPDGNLSDIGVQEARERGAEMGVMKNAKAYTSSMPRVVETARAVQQGAEIYNEFEQRNRIQLSADLLRTPGAEKPSHFFKEVVLKRQLAPRN